MEISSACSSSVERAECTASGYILASARDSDIPSEVLPLTAREGDSPRASRGAK